MAAFQSQPEVIHLQECASTSQEAHRLAGEGRQLPFVVTAIRQSAGRGRMGRAWESPPGNLFATFAFSTNDWPADRRTLLPLRAGAAAAAALRAVTGVRPGLKWPNDLVFGGRKLGGLLLETQVSGADMGHVLVGIGINVNIAPAIDGPYTSVSLARIAGRSFDPDQVRHDFVTAFCRFWAALDAGSVLAAFLEYSPSAGDVWYRQASEKPPEIWLQRGILDDGSLELQRAGSLETVHLNTIGHDFQWGLMTGSGAPLMLADCGNTSLKLVLYAGALDPGAALSWTFDDLDDPAPVCEAISQAAARVAGGVYAVHAVVAGGPALALLEAAAVKCSVSVFIPPKRPVRLKPSAYPIQMLGADRVAAMEGWLSMLSGESQLHPDAAVIVSMGTATTLDVVMKDGSHGGGYIIPGIATSLQCLHTATSALPALDPAGLPALSGLPALGQTTSTAMYWGIVRMTATLVMDTARELRSRQLKPLIILTGGYRPALVRTLQGEDIQEVPDLIFQGMRSMHVGGYIP